MLPSVRNNPGLAVFSERGYGSGISLSSAVSDYAILVFCCSALWRQNSQKNMVRMYSSGSFRFTGCHQYSSSDGDPAQPWLKRIFDLGTSCNRKEVKQIKYILLRLLWQRYWLFWQHLAVLLALFLL